MFCWYCLAIGFTSVGIYIILEACPVNTISPVTHHEYLTLRQ